MLTWRLHMDQAAHLLEQALHSQVLADVLLPLRHSL
jgi:hypothetical protein